MDSEYLINPFKERALKATTQRAEIARSFKKKKIPSLWQHYFLYCDTQET